MRQKQNSFCFLFVDLILKMCMKLLYSTVQYKRLLSGLLPGLYCSSF